MSYTFTGSLFIEECCNCHMTFAMAQNFQAKRRRDRKTFYCPRGHGQHYLDKTADEKKIERLTVDVELARTQRDRLMGLDEALTRDIRLARGRAQHYAPAQRGAFWRGHEDQECGREAGCCPYNPNNAGGFHEAWMDGFGAEQRAIVS